MESATNMKVFVDTNILISAMIWQQSNPAAALLHAARYHDIIVCEQNLYELRAIINKKFKKYIADIDVFLSSFSFEIVPSITDSEHIIRDAKDQVILNSAIVHGADIIITGDKDFLSLNIDNPRCLTATDYLKQYVRK